MKKYLVAFLFLGVSPVFADMIHDGQMNTLYEAAWVEAEAQGGCSTACRKEGVAEHEKFEAPELFVKRAHVCKAEVRRPGMKGELYGTNLLSKKYESYCFILGPDSVAIHAEKFRCLCAR